jgi:hypothetical protein
MVKLGGCQLRFLPACKSCLKQSHNENKYNKCDHYSKSLGQGLVKGQLKFAYLLEKLNATSYC